MCGLGELEAEREEWHKARWWFEKALKLARELGMVNMIAATQYGLARTWNALGRIDHALPLAQESLVIFERLQYMNVTDVKAFIKICDRNLTIANSDASPPKTFP
jgi:uncharacterized protein HemY